MRIVSLPPSATEIICFLGLRDQLVGVTHECDYPQSVQTLPRVTHTLIPTDATSRAIDELVRDRLKGKTALYSLDMATLENLRPDLIVTQALCDVCAVAEDEVKSAACSLPGNPKVLNLEPENLSDVLDAIRQVASATGIQPQGEELIRQLEERIKKITAKTQRVSHTPRVALLEWLDPPFSCGHWNPELVRLAGGVEGLGNEGARSRTLSWSEVIDWQPEVLLIACCGFSIDRTMEDLPALQSVPGFMELPAVQSDRVYVTDGSQYFSRPGPRLVDSLEILAHVIHPALFSLPPDIPLANVSHSGSRPSLSYHK